MTCCEEAPVAGESLAAAKGTPVVTIPPVHIYGDAGAQELVRRFTATSPECLPERHVVADATESVGVGVATTIAGAPTAWGAAAGLAATFHASRQTGEALAGLMSCEDRVLNRQEAVADCEARGGSVVSQTESEVECLVPAH
jgi:hypothetical protein